MIQKPPHIVAKGDLPPNIQTLVQDINRAMLQLTQVLNSMFRNAGFDGDIVDSTFTMATSRLLGRTTASNGEIEEIQIAGTNLGLSTGSLTFTLFPEFSTVKVNRIILNENSEPTDPGEGTSYIWQSEGTGAGDDGDIMIKITAGGVTKTGTLVDFSALP